MRHLLTPLAAVLAMCALATPEGARAATYTVPDHFSTIQEAVNAAASGDTVYVRPGIYYENVTIQGKQLTLRSLNGPEQTILDGQRLGPVISAMLPGGLTLEGFTIQNGGASGGVGGGLYVRTTGAGARESLTVQVSGCVIVQNEGGGVYFSGLPVYTQRIYATISNSVIANNASTWGSGVSAMCTDVTLDRVVIANNHALQSGGGIYSGYLAVVRAQHVFVTGNSADLSGGGAVIGGPWGWLGLYDSVMDRNSAGVSGGGIYGNDTSNGGNIGYLVGSTVTGNTAPKGAGLDLFEGSLNVQGSIVWGNSTAPSFGAAQVQVSNSDVEGGVIAGTGNISADPLFVSTVGRNYQLFAGSPAIDAGSSTGADLHGVTRPQGRAPDMGAYEWTEAIPPVSAAVVTGTLGPSGAYVTPATVTITAEDSSGVREIHYVVNGAETVINGASASLTLSTDGSYDVSWWSVDNYGNREVAKALPTLVVDVTTPAVASTSPAANATGVSRAASVVVTYAEQVVAADLSGVTLGCDGAPVTASATVAGSALTLTPAAGLASDATCTVTIPAGAVADGAGNTSAAFAFTFVTEAVPPVSTASVSGTVGTGGVYTSSVTVAFSATDDVAGGVRELHYTVNGAETTVAGASATLTLAATGTYAVTYWAVDVRGNAETPKALASVVVDVTRPVVASTTPANNATGVSRTASLVVTFSENVAQGAAFTGVVLRRGTSTVSVTRSLSGRTLTVRPSSTLSSQTTYTLTVPAGAVVDAAGNTNAAATTVTFRTGS